MAPSKLSDPTPAPVQPDAEAAAAAQYEAENVHAVYDAIAPHFSATRYKPWPLIPLFLASLPPGSLGADLGCGNGKYLSVYSSLAPRDAWVPTPPPKKGKKESKEKSKKSKDKPNLEVALQEADVQGGRHRDLRPGGSVLTLGVDRSAPLVEHAALNSGHLFEREHGTRTSFRNEAAVGDALLSGLRAQTFDYALSIATVHHFSTPGRRRAAIQELIRLVRPLRGPRRGAAFSASSSYSSSSSSSESNPGHASADPPRTPSAAAAEEHARRRAQEQMGSGPGRFMVYAWAMEQRGGRRAAAFEGGGASPAEEPHAEAAGLRPRQQDLLVPWVLAKEHHQQPAVGGGKEEETDKETKVYQRYYHVFTEGELESLVEEAGRTFGASPYAAGCRWPAVRVRREHSGWDRGNWWGVWSVVAECEPGLDACKG